MVVAVSIRPCDVQMYTKEGIYIVTVIDVEMNTTTRVQILDENVCFSHRANTFGKGMHPIIFPPTMGK